MKASELGIGAKVYEFDPENGVEVTEFLRDVIQPVLDANAEDVGQHVELNV